MLATSRAIRGAREGLGNCSWAEGSLELPSQIAQHSKAALPFLEGGAPFGQARESTPSPSSSAARLFEMRPPPRPERRPPLLPFLAIIWI
eukprot:9486600-Pyramimonas_sp.AAC.3